MRIAAKLGWLEVPRLGFGWVSIVVLAVTSSCWAQSLPDVIDDVQPKVVKLYGAGGLQNLAGYGSGVIVSPDGYIATVWSHLLDADVVRVVLSDGRRFFGKLVGASSEFDVAIVKIDAEELPFFDLEKSATVGPGAGVLAFSNMFKVATGDEPVTVVHGVVSAKTELAARRGRYRVPYSGDVYLVDAITNNSGAAGGALTTIDGRLLGLLGRELKSDESNTWINYAMPIGELRKPIQDIKEGKFTRRDPLAESMENQRAFKALDFGIVLVPDVVFRTPAYIEDVVDESVAAKNKLQPDDLIVFANGELVHSIRSLNEILGKLSSGGDLQLIVRRDSELITVTFPVPRN